MGVVYKIKQEIVDFIIAKKKEDISISCRKLVEVVFQQYQVKVSKSSVNAVIQEFHLSSPVGRRSVYKPPKNFAIPQHKKDILLQTVAPFLVPEPVPDLPGAPPGIPSESESIVLSEQKVVEPLPEVPEKMSFLSPVLLPAVSASSEEKNSPLVPAACLDGAPPLEEEILPVAAEEVVPGDSCGLKLMPDLLQRTMPLTEEIRIEFVKKTDDAIAQRESFWKDDAGQRYEGLGFLLAVFALCHAQRAPRLGKILAEKFGLEEYAERGSAIEALFLYHLFRDDSSAGIDSEALKLFHDIFQLDERMVDDILSRIISSASDANLGRMIASELRTASVRVQGTRVRTLGGKTFYLDALSSALESRFLQDPCGTAPLYSAIERAADTLVTNVQPIIIGEIPGGITQEMPLAFLRVMAGNDPIEAVDLLGGAGESVVSLGMIPATPKIFIAGVALSETDRACLDSDTIDNRCTFFDPFAEEELRCFDGYMNMGGDGGKVRIIMAEGREKEQKIVIMTNSAADYVTILFDYLSAMKSNKMGNLIQKKTKNSDFVGNNTNNVQNNESRVPLIDYSSGFYGSVLTLVKSLVLSHLNFSGFETVEEQLKIPGFFRKSSDGIFLRLLPPAESSCLDALQQSVFLMNQRNIHDYDGNRVYFSVQTA